MTIGLIAFSVVCLSLIPAPRGRFVAFVGTALTQGHLIWQFQVYKLSNCSNLMTIFG